MACAFQLILVLFLRDLIGYHARFEYKILLIITFENGHSKGAQLILNFVVSEIFIFRYTLIWSHLFCLWISVSDTTCLVKQL